MILVIHQKVLLHLCRLVQLLTSVETTKQKNYKKDLLSKWLTWTTQVPGWNASGDTEAQWSDLALRNKTTSYFELMKQSFFKAIAISDELAKRYKKEQNVKHKFGIGKWPVLFSRGEYLWLSRA